MKIQSQTANRCQNLRHLTLFIVFTLASFISLAGEVKLQRNSQSRAPASAYEEEVLTVPAELSFTAKNLFAEDDAGVMKGMRDSLEAWDKTDEYAKLWDLKSTGLFKTPTTKARSQFISKNLLRYADKRLAGEMKNAEAGSTMSAVSKVEQSLRPNASVAVSKYISFKLKARVLQGKVIMEVRNPWIECSATVKANGKVRLLTKKDFNQLGTSTGMEYSVNDAQWLAFVDQEITKNIKARLSSTSQPNGIDADNRLEMNASFAFNL